MQFIQAYTHKIEAAISEYKFPSSPSNLYKPLSYFMKIGGKRMRPILTLMGGKAFGKETSELMNAALCIELFHNFSLIHDDIMDEAPLRRGQETVHTKWNNNIAILSGDVLLVKAYQLLSDYSEKHLGALIKTFNKTAVEVCEGQQMDMDFEVRDDVSIDEYIEMIRLKTSVLLGCALKFGAIIGEANSKDAQEIYNFGQYLGIAFQIQDDLLDLYADPDKFGKQVGGDILSNKKTLLLLTAFESANSTEKEELNAMLKEENPTQKIILAKKIFETLSIQVKCKAIMKQYYDLAMVALNNTSISKENKAPFIQLAEFLMVREN